MGRNIVGVVLTVAFLFGASEYTYAAESRFFVEAGVGVERIFSDDYYHKNPNNYPNTLNKTRGDEIILQQRRNNQNGPTASASFGYNIDENIFFRGTYRYLGDITFRGNSYFSIPPVKPFEQALKIGGNGLFAGAGYKHPLNDKWFLTLSGEIGAAQIRTSGTQGANIAALINSLFGPPSIGYFPSKTQYNFGYGAELGVGYKIDTRWSILATLTYDRLGDVATGASPNNDPYLAPQEQLKVTQLQAVLGQIVVRYSF
jgi:opacity protein-like surface antigen